VPETLGDFEFFLGFRTIQAGDHAWLRPKPRRWRKMYKGRIFTVSCRELGKPETKEASYQAANRWWTKKLAEIEDVPRRSNDDILNELEIRRDVSRNMGAEPEADQIDQKIAIVRALEDEPREEVEQALYDLEVFEEIFPDNSTTKARIEIARRNGIPVADDIDPFILDYIFGDRRLKLDREVRKIVERLPEKAPNVPEDRAVAVQIDRFLALERVRVEGKNVSVGEYELVTRALNDFRSWIGNVSIETIDADRLEAWWSHLAVGKLSVETKKKKLRHVKSFINWLSEKGLIPSPPNLHSRRHRFGGGVRAVPTVPTADVKKLIDAASGQLRLHLLLMANCGMTQIDVSDLKPGEIDWDKGRIRRKRSKTEDHANVPVVDYPLWPETACLLRQYGQRSGHRALLTASGLPWVRDILKPDGRRSKVDNIKSNFAHIKKRLGLKYSMKLLRKTSASLLESEADFARYATLFLGHSPRTIADRHYVAPSQKNFDRAILWLGERLGFSKP